MSAWFQRLIADKDGNPNEHIIAAIWGSAGLIVLTCYLIYNGHPPTVVEYAGGHGTIWAAAGAGQRLGSGS